MTDLVFSGSKQALGRSSDQHQVAQTKHSVCQFPALKPVQERIIITDPCEGLPPAVLRCPCACTAPIATCRSAPMALVFLELLLLSSFCLPFSFSFSALYLPPSFSLPSLLACIRTKNLLLHLSHTEHQPSAVAVRKLTAVHQLIPSSRLSMQDNGQRSYFIRNCLQKHRNSVQLFQHQIREVRQFHFSLA